MEFRTQRAHNKKNMKVYHLEVTLKLNRSFLGDGFLSAHFQVTGNTDGYNRKHYTSRTTAALKSHTKHNRLHSHTHTRASTQFSQINLSLGRVNKTKAFRVSGSVLLQGTDGQEQSKVLCMYSHIRYCIYFLWFERKAKLNSALFSVRVSYWIFGMSETLQLLCSY